MKRILALFILMLIVANLAVAAESLKRKRVKPYQYGTVQMDNYSSKAGIEPVEFDHWVHRSRFTCRLCHVDLGFAMKTLQTEVRALDNERGYYCGACHNGKRFFYGQRLFRACKSGVEVKNNKDCVKCHRSGPSVEKEEKFYKLRADLPQERFGNGIDWESAEEKGLIKSVDFLKGVSVKRPDLVVQKDFDLSAKVEGMPDIIFSHKQHTVWNGCEVCHPDIFLGIRKGATQYTMIDLFQGRYCGVCHDTVAFPQKDCQRCHTEQVN